VRVEARAREPRADAGHADERGDGGREQALVDRLRAIAEQGRRELQDLFEKDADTRRSA
jgi:hypothetical protein